MPEDASQIGQVSVGVVAKGVEETKKQLDSVAQHAKQAQAAVNSAGGSGYQQYVTGAIKTGTPFDKIMNEERYIASTAAAAKAASTAATQAAAAVITNSSGGDSGGSSGGGSVRSGPFGGARQDFRNVFGLVAGVGAVVAVFDKLYLGMKQFASAGAALGKEIQGIYDQQKIHTTFGQDDTVEQRKNIENITNQQKQAAYFDKVGRGLEDVVHAAYGNAYDKLIDETINTAHDTAVKSLESYQFNRAQKQRQNAEEQAQLSEIDGIKRIQREREIAIRDLKDKRDIAMNASIKAEIDGEINAVNRIFDAREKAWRREREAVDRAFQSSAAQSTISRNTIGLGDLPGTAGTQNIERLLRVLNTSVRRINP